MGDVDMICIWVSGFCIRPEFVAFEDSSRSVSANEI